MRNLLNSHQVETAYERGWSQLPNGDLLAAAERDGFEVFVTTDKNMVDQQNLGRRSFAVVVLSSTSWPRIQAASESVKQAVDSTTPGVVTLVNIP